MLLRSHLLSERGFVHAFPTRRAKEADLYDLLGTEHIVQVKQVHGGRVEEAHAALGAEADAVIGRAGSVPVAVGVRVADCVPLLLANTKTGDVAAVHAGWRGIVAEVVRAAVEAMGGNTFLAAIGPCIGGCCFEVAGDVAVRIARSSQREMDRAAAVSALATPRVIVRETADKAHVDLRAAVRAQLLGLGLTDAEIEDVAGCTKHDAARFHSYRRDGADSGRMLAAIATRR